MHTGINACAAANAEVMVYRHVVTRTVVAHLYGADADAAVAVTAFIWVYINYWPKMFCIRIFVHKLPVT